MVKQFFFLLGHFRCFPHWLLFGISKNKSIIESDIKRWMEFEGILKKNLVQGLIYLLVFYPEFRNLFYHRIGSSSVFINWLCRKKSNLYLPTPKIGPGLFIQHGDSSIIGAKSIGSNCWINQEVSVGYSDKGKTPVVGNNVTFGPGSKVFGDITIGNNVIIGANAVVLKNVPDNCIVVGVPAYIVKRDGIKVREEL
ncbi:serine O-acetyltransferase [Cognataquiflexum rubidum]|uniref:serine O-acetyltransferase n=1 Tax=Cognataquiflexum rubidum TaxID=2922273 RepID=UPI001F138A18|nr:serine acetyltransferase [Cognataquiflexum rubidum]MCH6236505.1 serine acetyltransferase [Cognataquiflexum rubidum]